MASKVFFSDNQHQTNTVFDEETSAVDILTSLSQTLNAGITDPKAAQALLTLIRCGVNPEALAVLILELRSRREADAADGR